MDTQTQALVEHNRPPSVQGKEQENCAVRLEIVFFFFPPGGTRFLTEVLPYSGKLFHPSQLSWGLVRASFFIATPQLTIACCGVARLPSPIRARPQYDILFEGFQAASASLTLLTSKCFKKKKPKTFTIKTAATTVSISLESQLC